MNLGDLLRTYYVDNPQVRERFLNSEQGGLLLGDTLDFDVFDVPIPATLSEFDDLNSKKTLLAYLCHIPADDLKVLLGKNGLLWVWLHHPRDAHELSSIFTPCNVKSLRKVRRYAWAIDKGDDSSGLSRMV
ncbi:MAG: hypothetical protein ACMXYC_00715 [Candidatus Woesearchaeota archaeon]